MTIKSKNRICEDSKVVFNKIETYMDKKKQYIRLDSIEKYQLPVLYFDKKGIILEKSTPYTQDQDRIAERSLYTIIERACIILIYIGLPSKL